MTADGDALAEWTEAVSALTGDLGLGAVERLEPIAGGRNNRVYRVVAGGRQLLLKQYYRDAEDPRDRLSADFGFSRYAWESGIRAIAEPLIADSLLGLALYSFIEGSPLMVGDISAAHVHQALDLVVGLNRDRGSAAALALPFASEAVFCIADHLDAIESRIRRLARIAPRDPLDHAAVELVRDRLAGRWQRVRDACAPLAQERNLPARDRVLSPSDFGFHNAIETSDGRLIFHDFEYAGWDDPAKLLCDFFCQVEVPPPLALLPNAIDRIIRELGLKQEQRARIDVLMPAYRIKWCCIVLNEFLPAAARRREFARGSTDRRAAQLEQAARLLDGLR